MPIRVLKQSLDLEENPDPLQPPNYDQTKFENLIGWLYGNSKTGQLPLISSIRDIKVLDECLGNDRARKALENGDSLAEAYEELGAAGATIGAHLERARKSVERACGGPWIDLDAPGLHDVERIKDQLRAAVEQQLTPLVNQHHIRLTTSGAKP